MGSPFFTLKNPAFTAAIACRRFAMSFEPKQVHGDRPLGIDQSLVAGPIERHAGGDGLRRPEPGGLVDTQAGHGQDD
jgi:hypothetical protein